jgi:hypothetical protein
VNISNFATEIPPFVEVEFTIFIFNKHRRIRGIVQPSPRPLLGCILIDYEVAVEPEISTSQVDANRIYRSSVQIPVRQVKIAPTPTPQKRKLKHIQPDIWQCAESPASQMTKPQLKGARISRGWIEFKAVKRKRKSGKTWETQQAWLHWEEPGGQKRSRYIPKTKLADVERSIYEERAPLEKTLELLEK